jgi:hypothetical protein
VLLHCHRAPVDLQETFDSVFRAHWQRQNNRTKAIVGGDETIAPPVGRRALLVAAVTDSRGGSSQFNQNVFSVPSSSVKQPRHQRYISEPHLTGSSTRMSATCSFMARR